MQHGHAVRVAGQRDFHFLLDARGGLDSLGQLERLTVPPVRDGRVVRLVSARLCFGRVPETMAAVCMPGVAAGLAELIRALLEKILPAHKAEPDHTRSHVGRRHQLDPSIAQPDAILPSAVLDRFHFHCHSSTSRRWSQRHSAKAQTHMGRGKRKSAGLASRMEAGGRARPSRPLRHTSNGKENRFAPARWSGQAGQNARDIAARFVKEAVGDAVSGRTCRVFRSPRTLARMCGVPPVGVRLRRAVFLGG